MNQENSPYLSIIVPLYNEEDNVENLHRQIVNVGQKIGKPFEIIFINDGSTDKTLEKIKQLSPLTIISFRKNFGQTAAFDAGFKTAKGKILITMDGDLQNDPEDIPRLLEKMNEGYDVVSGWRKGRKDTFLKHFISRVANFLRQLLIKDAIHDSGCSLKAYKKECFETVDLYGEMHRFIPAILTLKGFKITEIVVHHRPRVAGKSKYGFSRTVKGFLDMIAVWFWKKYASRPLHLFGTFGLVMIGISAIAGLWAIYLKIVSAADLSDTALTDLSMFGFIMGIQMLIFGLIADMMSKDYYARSKDVPYVIKEIIEKK